MPVFQSSAGTPQSLMEVNEPEDEELDELVVRELGELVVGELDEPMEIDHQPQVQDNINHGPFIEVYEGSLKTYGQGMTFLTQFNSDKFSHECTNNLYYLFASRDKWKLASFLLNSKLSMQAIDTFLSLDFVRVNYYWKHESLTFSSDSKFEVVIFHGIKAARIS